MPAYGKNLSPAETTALVAFLETLHPAGQAPARDASRDVVLGEGQENTLARNHRDRSMSPHVHVASESWGGPISLTVALLLTEFLYLRGWLRLRSASVKPIPAGASLASPSAYP